MPLTPRKDYRDPDFWTVFGHSYFQYAFGTYYQTGRSDSLLRGALDIEHANWQNYAVNGARVFTEGASTGGYERILKRVNRPTRGGPYVSDGGTLLLGYGINDLGLHGNTTVTSAVLLTAFQHAMRTAISRWRASVIYENDFQVGTRTSYGAGFSSVGVTYCSGTTVHWCTATTNANFTLTLPSDYAGEPVGILLVGAGGVAGGIVTWGGTAGVTGTTTTSNIIPSADASHGPVLKRITNLTSANAGQTITGTVNTLDAGGAIMLDCWWLESKEPPPVIVCNTAKLTAAGYTGNYAGWTGTEAAHDADVDAWNVGLYSVVAEFDSMVQTADMDSAINKDANRLFTDGLHPNERGAARIVDAILEAKRRLTPTSDSVTANINPSAPRTGPSLRPRVSGQWYTADHDNAAAVCSPAAAAGDFYAIPIWVTQGREFWNRIGIEQVGAASTTGTLRWGLYDDVAWSGYPRELVNEATAAGAFTITTGAGAKQSPTSGGGSFTWVLDPGLYWLAFKLCTLGTSGTFRAIQGDNGVMPNVLSTGLIPASSALVPNCYKLTGQGTTAFPGTFPAAAVATASAPYIGIQVFIQPQNA